MALLMKGRCLPCQECRAAVHDYGQRLGYGAGYDSACEDVEMPSGAVWREDFADKVREVATEAHRNAGHGGRWEVCTDVVCAEMERWLHFETRPTTTAATAENVHHWRTAAAVVGGAS